MTPACCSAIVINPAKSGKPDAAVPKPRPFEPKLNEPEFVAKLLMYPPHPACHCGTTLPALSVVVAPVRVANQTSQYFPVEGWKMIASSSLPAAGLKLLGTVTVLSCEPSGPAPQLANVGSDGRGAANIWTVGWL